METSIFLALLALVLLLLLAGGLLAWLVARRRQTVRSAGDVFRLTELFVLARLPVFPSGSHLPAADADTTTLSSLQLLQTNVAWATVPQARLRLLITSPGRGEGKSFVAANLAITLARRGERVLLVDGHLERPVLHDWFGLDNDSGMTTLLQAIARMPAGERDQALNLAEKYAQPTCIDNLFLLTSGPPAAPAFHGPALPGAAYAAFDSVIIDAPAVSELLRRLAPDEWRDALIVAAAGRTQGHALRRVVAQLPAGRVRLIGVVLNKVKRRAAARPDGLDETLPQEAREREPEPLPEAAGAVTRAQTIPSPPAGLREALRLSGTEQRLVAETAAAPIRTAPDWQALLVAAETEIGRLKVENNELAHRLGSPPAQGEVVTRPRPEPAGGLNGEPASTATESAALRQALANQQALAEMWESKARNLEQFVAYLRQERGELQTRATALAEKLAGREQKLKRLEEEVLCLERKLAQTRGELSSSLDKLAAAQLTMQRQREEIAIYNQLLARLENTAGRISPAAGDLD